MNRAPYDQHTLNRFLEAQCLVYDQVLRELRSGLKMTHWIWFIFPQIKGLGSSAMSRKYSISLLEKAAAYLDHRILGPRLLECATLVIDISDRNIKRILGPTDCEKFRSSMTLFSRATSENQVFETALDKYFSSQVDQLTIKILEALSKTGDFSEGTNHRLS